MNVDMILSYLQTIYLPLIWTIVFLKNAVVLFFAFLGNVYGISYFMRTVKA